LCRAERQTIREFKPDFSSSEPLLKLGLTPPPLKHCCGLPKARRTRHRHILGITEST